MFQWADHVDTDHIALVRDALDSLPDQIEQIRRYVHGSDVGVSEGNFDYVIVADFDTVVDWRAYLDHPTHVLFVEELIKGNVANRSAVQFQTPAEESAHDVSLSRMEALLAAPDEVTLAEAQLAEDDELLERARRAAVASMEAILADPDDR